MLIKYDILYFMQILLYYLVGYLSGFKLSRSKKEIDLNQKASIESNSNIKIYKNQSEKLHELEEQLRLSGRLAVIGELTAGLAHEIRNPLNTKITTMDMIKEEFQEAADEGVVDRVKREAKEIGRKIKKGYFSLRKKYAKVQIQDQMTLGDVLDIWRNRFAVYLLIPIAIGSLIFTPVAFICIIFWLKIFIFDKGEPKFYERIALLISMIWIATITCLSYAFKLVFFTSIEPFFWTIQVFYLIGIIISTVIYLYQFIKLKGITIKKVKEEIREIRSADENKD